MQATTGYDPSAASYSDPYDDAPTSAQQAQQVARATTRADRQRDRIASLNAAIDAERRKGKADADTIRQLQEMVDELREQMDTDAARNRDNKRGADTSLSPLAYGLGGAAAGAVLASFVGRTVVEGAVVGTLLGAGYSYAMAPSGRRS